MDVQGDFFDGNTSARHAVSVDAEGDRLLVRGEGIARDYPLSAVRLSPRLGALPRTLTLPDGARCEIPHGPLAVRLESREGRFFAGVHRWERSLRRALAALAVTALLVWGFLHFGIPLLARPLAHAVPPAAEARMGQEGLALLDRLFFAPSALPEPRRGELQALFRRVASTLGAEGYRLELRASPRIGANAFALPAGTVVLTDELVALAKDDEEIAAVLAHEIGHARHRHALRHLLQNSAATLVVATLTGDIASAASLAATLPTVLIDSKYSRDMEREADADALRYLDARGLPRRRFADILLRLEASRAGPGKTAVSIPEYLSTHPDTRERVEAFR